MSPAPTSAPVLIGGGNGVIVSYRDSNHTYALHGAPPAPDADLEAFHRNGAWCPSVTGIIDPWSFPSRVAKGWAANATIRGFAALVRKEGERGYSIDRARARTVHGYLKGTNKTEDDRDTFGVLSSDLRRVSALYWQISGEAALRGTDVHTIIQDWVERGAIPVRQDWPADRWGYVQAFGKFITDHRPEFLSSESIVGSRVHGYAGRMDTVARLRIDGWGESLLDYKSSKAVYPKSMFRQLAGYDLAAVECGARPTDAQGIVRLGKDGEYELVRSTATHEMFVHALACWRDDRALEPPKRRR